jgi:hypothetical protein
MVQTDDVQFFNDKIIKLKSEFELIKKNIGKAAFDFAITTFKERSLQMSELFTSETMKLLNQYTVIRNYSLLKDVTIK